MVAHPIPEKDGVFYQVAFDNIAAAAQQAQVFSESGKDAYFAVGSMDNLGKYAKRKGENAVAFKSFFIDIDCGEAKFAKGEGYLDQASALVALKAFIIKLNLPKPILVNSGYGWHVYWTLTEDISAAEWLPVAQRFKQVVKHAGLIADNTRTADRASVLRVPGTFNYKRGLQAPVAVAKWAEPCTLSAFCDPLEQYAAQNCLQELTTKVYKDDEALALLKEFGIEGNTDKVYAPANFDTIIERCPTIRYCVENNADLDEPLWRAALSIAKFSRDPDEAAYKVSANHPDYSANTVESKLSGIPKPLTCEYIRTIAKSCEECTESCKSPITLGRPFAFQEAGTSELSPTVHVSVMPADAPFDGNGEPVKSGSRYTVDGFECDYPNGYDLNFSGIVTDVAFENEDGQMRKKRLTICSQPIRFIRRVSDFALGEDVATFSIKFPFDGWRELDIRLRDIVDAKGGKVCQALATIGCMVDGKEQKYIGEFMSAYLRAVIAAAAASKSYSQLGFTEDSELFVLHDKSIKKDGTVIDSGISSTVAPIAKAMRKNGTLEDWLKVINVYSRPGYEPYAFGHAIAYGSLLFRYTDYDGAIVTLLGDSGSGKSTVLRTINSVFGHPKDLMLQQRDSDVSKFIQIATMRNIAPCYDEISNIDAKELSDLCYGISQGRDKRRGAQAGGLRDDELTWCCIMPVTSNHSLYERLGTLKSDASAESMRVFEYQVRTDMQLMGKREAQDTFEPLSNNYGHAGEIFVSWLMQNQEKARERVKYWFNRFDEEANVPSKERYWSAVVGATIAGAELSSNLGLNKFDAEKLFTFAITQAGVARATVGENKTSAVALLVDYINKSIRSTIVLGGGTADKGKPSPLWVKQEPNMGLTMRVEIDRNVAYISRTDIKKWVTEGGGDYQGMRSELMAKGVIVNDKADKVLSADSNMTRSGQLTCWLIDLNHREMSGGVAMQLVKMNKVEDLPKAVDGGNPF